jgi:hypothetical protein
MAKKMLKLGLLSLAVASILISVSGQSELVQANTGSTGLKSPSLSDVDFENNLKFRKEFGLDTDSSKIKLLINEKKKKSFGAFLSDDEEAEMNRRVTVQDKLPNILNSINNQTSEKIATMYIDQAAGGIVKLGFKDITKINKASILSLFDKSDRVEISQIKYSQQDLDELHKHIDSSIKELIEKGIGIVSVETDIKSQKVIINVENTSTSVENELNKMFNPEMISIRVDKKKENFDRASDKYRAVSGGPMISMGSSGCTNGFSAKNSSGAYYLITAGHCFSGSGAAVYQSYFSGTDRQVGTTSYSNVYWGTTADAGSISVNSAVTTSWISDGNTAQKYSIASRQLSDSVGLMVCSSLGYTNTDVCSTVASTDYSYLGGTTWFSHHRKTNITVAQAGDSGSPVYVASCNCGNYVAIYGIVTAGSTGSDTEVAYITNIESELGVSALTNSTNGVTLTRY